MKKICLTFAALGLFFATAQAQEETPVTAQADIEVQAPVLGEEFVKIELTELPAAVTEALAKDFDEATPTEAFVKEEEGKKVYKIKLDTEEVDGAKEVYADENGHWIDKDDVMEVKEGVEMETEQEDQN